MTTTSEPLALLGGQPLAPEPLTAPAWPPVSEATADRLRELYLSRQWSFHSPAEHDFASAFATHHDARHGVFMVNGTVTLQAALTALGVGPGDEVIVPALTWMATALAVHYVGATPVFVDVEPTTLCIDPAAAEAAVTSRTRAIIPVHLYASMADLDAILAMARRHSLAVIEDCAHMHGAQWAGRGAGSWGDVGSFSFQQSKTLSSGEGGICLTQDDQLAQRLFRIKHIGYAMNQKQGEADSGPPAGLMCHNFRATAFQAVILQDQLKGLTDRLERYDATRSIIASELDAAPGFRVQARGRAATRQGCYALVLIADQPPLADLPRSLIADALRAEGLPAAGPTYGPVYRHRLYNMPPNTYRIAEGGCPIAEHIGHDRTFVLPHPWLDAGADQARQIARIFTKVAANAEALAATKPLVVD